MEEEGRGAPRRVQVNKFTGGRRVYVRRGRFAAVGRDDGGTIVVVVPVRMMMMMMMMS